MSELKIGTKFFGRVEGVGDVECEVTDLLPDGNVEVSWGDGSKQVVAASMLMPRQGGFSISATAPVAGLQPDPPAHIARMAEKGIAILPSPVAPETDKSGIVPTGEVSFVGQDGFLHVVDSASS
jgi:hypothetical protein